MSQNVPEIYKRYIKEYSGDGTGRLGRHVAHDPRSREYKAEEAKNIVEVHHSYLPTLPLDQSRGSCTAEALCGALDTEPDIKSGRVFDQANADDLYNAEIVAEGGNPSTDDPGGTGLLVCKVAKKRGWIRSYTHTFSFTSMLRALVLRPVMLGSNWYAGFDHPDSRGIVQISDSIRGGHEYLGIGIYPDMQLIECMQSWGPWGFNNTGKFYIPFAVMERLLDEEGDVTVPQV